MIDRFIKALQCLREYVRATMVSISPGTKKWCKRGTMEIIRLKNIPRGSDMGPWRQVLEAVSTHRFMGIIQTVFHDGLNLHDFVKK